jgi:hypothetical protein
MTVGEYFMIDSSSGKAELNIAATRVPWTVNSFSPASVGPEQD